MLLYDAQSLLFHFQKFSEMAITFDKAYVKRVRTWRWKANSKLKKYGRLCKKVYAADQEVKKLESIGVLKTLKKLVKMNEKSKFLGYS